MRQGVDHLLFLLFTFVVALQLLQLFYGSTGLLRQGQLNEQLQRLGENVDEMLSYQDQLQNTLTRAKNDGNYIVVRARSLGFYGPGESLILLNSWQRELASPEPGRLEPVPLLPAVNEKPLVGAALIIAFSLSVLHGYLPRRPDPFG